LPNLLFTMTCQTTQVLVDSFVYFLTCSFAKCDLIWKRFPGIFYQNDARIFRLESLCARKNLPALSILLFVFCSQKERIWVLAFNIWCLIKLFVAVSSREIVKIFTKICSWYCILPGGKEWRTLFRYIKSPQVLVLIGNTSATMKANTSSFLLTLNQGQVKYWSCLHSDCEASM